MSNTILATLLIWLTASGVSVTNKALDRAAINNALTCSSAAIAVPQDTAVTTTLRMLAKQRGLHIGAAVEALPLVREADFARLLVTQFSMLATENRMKFNIIHPERDRYDFTHADVIVRFAEANKMAVRGHCFIWHDHFPPWLSDKSTTEADSIVREHIHTVMKRYAGRVRDWDVVNEVVADDGKMRDTPWRRLLGENYIEKAFRWAREADPNARLFLNDFGIETICPKSDTFYKLVNQLQAAKVPLDGLGFQMHLNLAAGLSTTSLKQNLQRFADLGLEMHVTEMDVSLVGADLTSASLSRQADMYRDVLSTTLSFPQFKAIVFWGASDRHSWMTQPTSPPDAPLLFDKALKTKPAYQGVVDALNTVKR